MGISDEKGPEYAGSTTQYTKGADVLANFRRQGERYGVSPIVALGIYYGKHVDSIETFIRGVGESSTTGDLRALAGRGEGIQSRLDDARNYLDLLECLLIDEGVLGDSPNPFSVLGD